MESLKYKTLLQNRVKTCFVNKLKQVKAEFFMLSLFFFRECICLR